MEPAYTRSAPASGVPTTTPATSSTTPTRPSTSTPETAAAATPSRPLATRPVSVSGLQDTRIYRNIMRLFEIDAQIKEHTVEQGELNQLEEERKMLIGECKILICSGNVRTVDEHGNTLLHLLAGRHGLENKELIELLVDHGADVNAVNPETGQTPLHIAAENNLTANFSQLLKYEAISTSIMTADHRGMTPLHLVAQKGKASMVNDLTGFWYSEKMRQSQSHILQAARQAALMADQYGRIPLHYAVLPFQSRDIIEGMIELEFEHSSRLQDNDGKTALNILAESPRYYAIRFMLCAAIRSMVVFRDVEQPGDTAQRRGEIKPFEASVSNAIKTAFGIPDKGRMTPFSQVAKHKDGLKPIMAGMLEIMQIEIKKEENARIDELVDMVRESRVRQQCPKMSDTTVHDKALNALSAVFMNMLEYCDKQGRTPLHHLALNDDADTMGWLLEKVRIRTHMVNTRDVNGKTFLHSAVEQQNLNFFKPFEAAVTQEMPVAAEGGEEMPVAAASQKDMLMTYIPHNLIRIGFIAAHQRDGDNKTPIQTVNEMLEEDPENLVLQGMKKTLDRLIQYYQENDTD